MMVPLMLDHHHVDESDEAPADGVKEIDKEDEGNRNDDPHPHSEAAATAHRHGGRGGEGLMGLNDNVDVLGEILCRLDGRSLGVAACVCRLWNGLCRRDAVWERAWRLQVCGGGGSVAIAAAGDPRERSVVVALGGYRRLYQVCVGPVLGRMQRRRHRVELVRLGGRSLSRGSAGALRVRKPHQHHHQQQHQHQRSWRWSRDEAQLSLSLFSVDCYERLTCKSSSSLMFLCKAR